MERAFIGFEDHGILAWALTFDYGSGAHQGTGAWIIGPRFKEELTGILGACGIESWNQIVGRTVYVLHEDDKPHSPIVGIEPLPTEPGTRFMLLKST